MVVSRRGLFRTPAIAMAALAGLWAAIGASSPAAAAGELHVLNWQGYGTDEAWALKMFEERTGLKVVHDYFNSEQEMLTKLRTSPGTYDVVLINNTFTEQAAKEGLLQPIDPGKITNFADLTPQLRDSPRFNIDGKPYGLAWLWGVTSFAYNTESSRIARSRSRFCGIRNSPAMSAGATTLSNPSRWPRWRPART